MIKSDEEIDRLDNSTPFVYAYVRKDIPLVQQLIQAGHALYGAGVKFGNPGFRAAVPHFCIFEVENREELNGVMIDMQADAVAYYVFDEPDFEMGYTALATEPLIGVARMRVPAKKLLRMPKRHIW